MYNTILHNYHASTCRKYNTANILVYTIDTKVKWLLSHEKCYNRFEKAHFECTNTIL